MKMRSIIVGFAVTLSAWSVFAAVGAGAAQAADAVSVSRVPVSFSLFNPRTDETVDFSGNALVVIDTTPEDDHGLSFHSVDIGVTGIGQTTGTPYPEHFTVTVSVQGTESTSDNGAYAETNAVHSRVIAPGPANDLVFAIVFHFTIDGNGEVVGWHNRVTAEACV